MISLKATSISRKKLSFLLLFLLLPLALQAAPFRTAVVCDDERYSSLILDALAVLSGEVTSEESIAAYSEKEREAWERERNVSLSRLRQNESFQELSARLGADDAFSFDDTLTLEIVNPEFSDIEKEYLKAGDEEAFSYLMIREDLDLLIAADVLVDGMLTECDVYANGEEIHHNLYISSDDTPEFESLLSALLPVLRNEDAVIVHIDVPSVVSVAVDGSTVSIIRSVLVLDRGEHVLSFTSPVYQRMEMTIEAENGLVVKPELRQIPPSRLFISTVPYDAEIYFQGLRTDSHFIGEADVPFQVTVLRSGFSPLTIQSRVPMERLNLELRPEWMEDADIVGEAKGRFYTNLLATLISFGCYVASDALSGIYADADIAPAAALFAGVSLVQLVELFDSMFDYYQAASLGI